MSPPLPPLLRCPLAPPLPPVLIQPDGSAVPPPPELLLLHGSVCPMLCRNPLGQLEVSLIVNYSYSLPGRGLARFHFVESAAVVPGSLC